EVDKELKNPKFPPGSLPRKIAIDDLPLNAQNERQFNAVIDVKADYRLHTEPVLDTSGNPVVDSSGNPITRTEFGVPNNHPEFGMVNQAAPLATGGFPGGIAVQTRTFPLTVTDASGDDSLDTVMQHGALSVSFTLSAA